MLNLQLREKLFPLVSKRIPFCHGENVPEETRKAMGHYADQKIVHYRIEREMFLGEIFFRRDQSACRSANSIRQIAAWRAPFAGRGGSFGTSKG